jgi:O-acetylhomoserine (thiol)-lyase
MGLDTLILRKERATSNALELARWLESIPEVKHVHYPGLQSSPFYNLAREQFGEKPCSILTFDLESKERGYAFMNRLKVIRRATNLQDNKTLVIHPYSTIFSEYTRGESGMDSGYHDQTFSWDRRGRGHHC